MGIIAYYGSGLRPDREIAWISRIDRVSYIRVLFCDTFGHLVVAARCVKHLYSNPGACRLSCLFSKTPGNVPVNLGPVMSSHSSPLMGYRESDLAPHCRSHEHCFVSEFVKPSVSSSRKPLMSTSWAICPWRLAIDPRRHYSLGRFVSHPSTSQVGRGGSLRRRSAGSSPRCAR